MEANARAIKNGMNMNKTFNQLSKNDKYKLFINSMIPKTRILFDLSFCEPLDRSVTESSATINRL